jgi:cholesterol oxidase
LRLSVPVRDAANRFFAYEDLMACDGAAIPANPGANPSLTITALAEQAMAQVPAKDDVATGARSEELERAR